MTRELRNAVSRLRKLQDAAFAGKIECPSLIVNISFHNTRYYDGNRCSVDVSVNTFNEFHESEKHLYFSMSDKRCYEIGGDDTEWSIEDILHEISLAVNYQV